MIKIELRHLVWVCVVTMCVYHEYMDRIIEKTWEYLLSTWLVTHESCEPMVAALSWCIGVNGYRLIDTFFPSKMDSYRITPLSPLSPPSKTPVPPDRYVGIGFEFKNYLAYLVPITIFDYLHPRRNDFLSSFNGNSPSFYRLIAEVSFGIAAYDWIFMWIHLGI